MLTAGITTRDPEWTRWIGEPELTRRIKTANATSALADTACELGRLLDANAA